MASKKKTPTYPDRCVKIGKRLFLPDHFYAPQELVDAGFATAEELAIARERREWIAFHRIGPMIWYRGSDIIMAVEAARMAAVTNCKSELVAA